jgi:hypothetical protein
MSVHCIAIGYANSEGVVIRAGDGYQAQAQELTNETNVQDDTPTEQASKPLFTWSDETIGYGWTPSGCRAWNWSQSEQEWIRTGC